MRYLNKGNKKSFVIFGVSISFILGVFSIFILNYVNKNQESYPVSSGSVIYDKNENYIKTTEEGKIDKLWNGEYSLKVGDEKHSLGKQSVVYETNTNKIISYGNIYQVKEDASVVAEDKTTEASSSSELSFYKLADRKYLAVSDEIEIPDQDLKTENYLLVDIDKGGTSKVYNDKLNLKILEPVEIKFGNYTLDIASEILKTDKEEISLAKIGGSTNEYLDIADKNDNKDNDQNNNNDTENTGNDGSVLNNGSTINNNTTNNTNNNTNNTINNQNNNILGNLSGILGNINNNNNNSQNKPNNNTNEDTIKKESTLRINYITSGISELSINYSILDYEDKYSKVYLVIEDNNGNKQNIILSKSENTRTIYGLQPDTPYTVSMGATISKIVGGVEENEDIILDQSKTRTDDIDVKLSVEKFSSNNLQFKLKFNNDLTLESGKVVLYADGNKISEKNIDGELANKTQGWVESFDLEDIDSVKTLTLKLEDTVYNGQKIDLNKEVTIQNSFIGNTVRVIKNIFNMLLKGEI